MTLALPDFVPDLVKTNARLFAIGSALLLAALTYFLFFASSPADGQQGSPDQAGPPPAIVTLAKIEQYRCAGPQRHGHCGNRQPQRKAGPRFRSSRSPASQGRPDLSEPASRAAGAIAQGRSRVGSFTG